MLPARYLEASSSFTRAPLLLPRTQLSLGLCVCSASIRNSHKTRNVQPIKCVGVNMKLTVMSLMFLVAVVVPAYAGLTQRGVDRYQPIDPRAYPVPVPIFLVYDEITESLYESYQYRALPQCQRFYVRYQRSDGQIALGNERRCD